jgi:hypothetical protein
LESLISATLVKRRLGALDNAGPIVGLAASVDPLDKEPELLARPLVAADGRIAVHPCNVLAEAKDDRPLGPGQVVQRAGSLFDGTTPLLRDLAKTCVLQNLVGSPLGPLVRLLASTAYSFPRLRLVTCLPY